jgi:hypothetical protein
MQHCKFLLRWLPVLALLISLDLAIGIPAAYSQSATATLSGNIEDQNGAVVSGASVTVQNIATSLERQATTSSAGSFTIPLLPPGTYIVTVRRDGFTPAEIRDVVLNVNDQRSLQIQLKVGQIGGETVNVNSDPSLIDESPAVGTVVDRRFVENLPLNGRSFQALIALTPGVTLTKATSSEAGQFSVNGQRASANYFTIDGVSANIGSNPGNQPGQSTSGALPGFSALGSTSNLVSIDAMQEFKVQTSTFAAEYGRTPGAQVSIITRSGTNEFHGSLFDYFRNEVLDASDWFANQAGLPKPALRQNDFGGVFGGPILKNKTFFFFSYEGLRLRLPQTGITSVPSITARQAAPTSIRPFLDAFPLPNGADQGNGFAAFSSTYSDPSTLDAASIRIDHAVNNRLTFFGRYNYAPSETSQRGGPYSLSTVFSVEIKTQTLTGGATILITPTLINEVRANYSSNRGTSRFSQDNFGGATPPSDATLFSTGTTSRDSSFFFNLGAIFWNRGFFEQDTARHFNLADTVSLTTGTHQLKMGADYRRLFPIFNRANYGLSSSFQSVAQALTGKAFFVTVSAFTGPRLPVFNNLSLFAQDIWKATSRLTLTYGLRWEFNPPPHEAEGNDPLVLIVNSPASITLAPQGTSLYKTSYHNFAPRLGLAYQLSNASGRETVVRGGFGVFYDLGNSAAASAFGLAPPYNRSRTVAGSFTPAGVAFPLDAISAAPPPLASSPPFGNISGQLAPGFDLPYTYQWNATVEQSLGRSQTVTASYVAAIARRLTRQEFLPSQTPGFSSLFLTRSVATSDYHSLQLLFQRRLSHGLQGLASYTWSHSIDDVSSDSSFQPPLTNISLAGERASSDFDVRHAFKGALSYDIPSPAEGGLLKAISRNFSADAIFTARSATPINVTTGANGAGGFSASRPDLAPGVPLYITDPNVGGGKRINRAAFTIPVGRQGTLGRNALRGFGLWQLDFALRRQFSLTERFRLQFKSEFFNIFNHPNFADPGLASLSTNALNSALFGQSTVMFGRGLSGSGSVGGGFNHLYQVGGSRSIQLALKLLF